MDQALTELDQQRAAHMKQDSELQEARAVAEKNAACQVVPHCCVDVGFGPSENSPLRSLHFKASCHQHQAI